MYCPICGESMDYAGAGHHCRQEVLDAIDRADRAAQNENDGHWYEMHRTEGYRIEEGSKDESRQEG